MKEQQELLQQLQKDVEEIKFNDTKRDKADICVLRNMITQMYYDYLDERTLPIYIRENLVHLYEEYEKKHGNSYVKQIYTEMLDWDISNL